MQYKLKHRLSAALMAGAMCCTMIPAASADEIATPETVDTAHFATHWLRWFAHLLLPSRRPASGLSAASAVRCEFPPVW